MTTSSSIPSNDNAEPNLPVVQVAPEIVPSLEFPEVS